MLTTRRKIHTLDWTRSRAPIKRSKLAHEVARKLKRYLIQMAVRSQLTMIDFTVAHKYIVEYYPGRVYRRSMEDRHGFHGHRQYVPRPPRICLQGILPTGDLGGRPVRLTRPRGPGMSNIYWTAPPSQVENMRHLYLLHLSRAEYTLTSMNTGILQAVVHIQ